MGASNGILDIILMLVTLAVVELTDISVILEIILMASVLIYTWFKIYYLIKNKGK